MTVILNDPIFFYAVAYVLFLALAWFFIRKPVLKWLDGEIGKIRDELEQARRLRAEAEAALADAKTKKAATLAEAEAIIAHAREEAARREAAAVEGLKFVLAKHEKHTLERIRYMEEDAVAQVRRATVEMAMNLVRKTLAEQMDDSIAAKLADQAIADMSRLVATKARAA